MYVLRSKLIFYLFKFTKNVALFILTEFYIRHVHGNMFIQVN